MIVHPIEPHNKCLQIDGAHDAMVVVDSFWRTIM